MGHRRLERAPIANKVRRLESQVACSKTATCMCGPRNRRVNNQLAVHSLSTCRCSMFKKQMRSVESTFCSRRVKQRLFGNRIRCSHLPDRLPFRCVSKAQVNRHRVCPQVGTSSHRAAVRTWRWFHAVTAALDLFRRMGRSRVIAKVRVSHGTPSNFLVKALTQADLLLF